MPPQLLVQSRFPCGPRAYAMWPLSELIRTLECSGSEVKRVALSYVDRRGRRLLDQIAKNIVAIVPSELRASF